MTEKNNKKVELKDEDLEVVNGGLKIVNPGEACQYGRTVFDVQACKGCIYYSIHTSGYPSCDAGLGADDGGSVKWTL